MLSEVPPTVGAAGGRAPPTAYCRVHAPSKRLRYACLLAFRASLVPLSRLARPAPVSAVPIAASHAAIAAAVAKATVVAGKAWAIALRRLTRQRARRACSSPQVRWHIRHLCDESAPCSQLPADRRRGRRDHLVGCRIQAASSTRVWPATSLASLPKHTQAVCIMASIHSRACICLAASRKQKRVITT